MSTYTAVARESTNTIKFNTIKEKQNDYYYLILRDKTVINPDQSVGINTDPILPSQRKTKATNNNSFTNSIYPQNTAVFRNIDVPYLGIKNNIPLPDPSLFYTQNVGESLSAHELKKISDTSVTTFTQNFYNKKQNKEFFIGREDANTIYNYYAPDTSLAMQQILQDFIDNQINTQNAQDISAQNLNVEYFYYRSMAGTCPGCVVEGGDFSLRFGVSFPSGDGPLNNEQGFPLVASSCAELEQEIANTLASYSDTSMELGYPIDWTITYKDGTVVSGSGCENVPEDFADASSQSFAGLSGPGCEALATQYSGINIYFDSFDTEVVVSSSGTVPIVGTPCSDLFGRLI
jgi:hypothetical protein